MSELRKTATGTVTHIFGHRFVVETATGALKAR
jgi:hypothetical protein